MRLLAIGDVFGSVGCGKVLETLPMLKREQKIDAVIINGENAAHGNGITKNLAETLFAAGADVITGGNHSFAQKGAFDYLDQNEFILRPHNIPSAPWGKGYCLVDYGSFSMAVINLSGTVYLEKLGASSPFDAADKLIEKAKRDGANIIAVDFHAEATSEKRALGLYLDGRVSAFFGTHTHIQTADEQILKNGTGYITDLGMTGPADSILGVKSEIIIDRFINDGKKRFEPADGECSLNGCIFDIDKNSSKTVCVTRVNI